MVPTSPRTSTDSPPLRSTILGSFLGRGRSRNYHDNSENDVHRETSPIPISPILRGGSGIPNPNPAENTSSSAPGPGHGFSSMLRRRRSANNVTPNPASPVPLPVLPPAASPVPPRANAEIAPAPSSSGAGPFRLRLVPNLESHRSFRFDAITRDMRTGDPVLRLGRFTDRSGNNTTPNGGMNNNNPSSFKLAFRSKVVSRTHAELWVEVNPAGSGSNSNAPSSSTPKFYVRDTKSSSGTFLNHVRLGPPGSASPKYEIRDGDLLQLGVDYQGGSEDIYKSVKMRVELGREWQSGVNKFNSNAIKNLESLAKAVAGPAAGGGKAASKKKKGSKGVGLPDCCICLFPLAICQSLFISGPCSHSFHFKCIRPLLERTYYRSFTCPLCRTYVDLDEDVEVEMDEEEDDVDVEDDSSDVGINVEADADIARDGHGDESETPVPGRPEESAVDVDTEQVDSGRPDIHDGTNEAGISLTAPHRATSTAKANVNNLDSISSSSKRKREHGDTLISPQNADPMFIEGNYVSADEGEDVNMHDGHGHGHPEVGVVEDEMHVDPVGEVGGCEVWSD